MEIEKPYLLLNVVERIRRIDGEANQDNVRIGVRKRSQTIVIFLASRIPKGQLNVFAINFDIGNIVFKNGRDVDLLEKKRGLVFLLLACHLSRHR